MKITKITASGLKGLPTFSHELDRPVSVFAGDNMAGKTAALDALKIALLGYHPDLGKRKGDTLKIATNGNLNVSVSTSSGDYIRRLTRKENDASIPEDALITPVLLDPAEFQAKSKGDRISWVLGMSQVETPDVTEAIRKENAAAHPDQTTEIVDSIMDLGEEATLDEITEHLKTQESEAKAAIKAASGFMETQDAVSWDETAALDVASQIEEVEAEIHAGLIAQEREEARIREATSQAEAVTARNAAKTKAYQTALASWEKKAAQVEGLKSQISDWKVSLEEAQAKAPARAALDAALKEVVAKHDENLAAAIRTGTQATSARIQLEKLQAEYERIMSCEDCPTCKSKGTAWRDAFQAYHEAQVEPVKKAFQVAQVQAQTYQKAADEFHDEVEKIKAEIRAVAAATQAAMDYTMKINAAETAIANLGEAPAKPELEEVEGMTASEIEDIVKTATSWVQKVERDKERLRGLKTQQAEAERAKQDEKRRIQAQERKEEAEGLLEVLKSAIAIVKAAQEELLRDTVDGVLGKAHTILDGIIPGDLSFDTKAGDFVLVRNGHGIPIPVLSGMEAAIVQAAIAVTLHEGPAILVIDDLGVMTRKNQEKFLSHVAALCKDGILDQVITTAAWDDDYLPEVDGIQIVKI